MVKAIKQSSVRVLLAIGLGVFTFSNFAAESFEVEDIRVKGLLRVSIGTIFNQITMQVHDEADALSIRTLIRELFATGYFDDITVSRDGSELVVEVVERPWIESITIEGNKAIQTEDLLEGLAGQGLREGEIFKQATLERVALELERQYVAQGQYTASVTAVPEPREPNRVAINIVVEEGKRSRISQISFIGNTSFSKETLLEAIELKEPTLLGFLTGKNQYSRQKLQGDIKSLQAFYKDRGYYQYQLVSADVSMTPDRKQVYLTIAIDEGDKFVVDEIDVSGDFGDIDPDQVLANIKTHPSVKIEPGETYSEAKVTKVEEFLETYLSNNGYTFAQVDGYPMIQLDGTVDITFVFNTGSRVYVRRIDFTGNVVTQDTVLRREMRQLEGARASTFLIERSKRRLERLGYFENVNVEAPPVKGANDLIDVEVTVSEQPTGSIGGTLGYQKYGGLLLGANFEQSNIGGSGNSVSIAMNYSQYSKNLNFSFLNPYFTDDGVSRGLGVYFNDTDYGSLQAFTQFSTESFGAGANFGFPIGDFKRLQFSGRGEWTDVADGTDQALQISDFVDRAGAKFLNYKVEGLWSNNVLNNTLFATRGNRQEIALEVSLPGSDLQFMRTTFRGDWYIPFRDKIDWAWHIRTHIGLGLAYGDTEEYPFFEHFHGGGFGSVRGFERYSLGPRSSPSTNIVSYYPDGQPFGGNVRIEGSFELVFPLPFLENLGQVRSVAFLDAGNIFSTDCDEDTVGCYSPTLKELRFSIGVGVSWLTQMGPMSISIAHPINAAGFDEVETFSFEVGQTF
ncbi:MAG: outer membrane protein assembly factor BamA [Gammaproteobacteria bacterium]|nr:outer membrane protein assembly factor BamA [Gammaproteobacteria bacterium]MYF38955.1 outer membrane protein assembly factor BamA [Gammaproteobacteria bacterium]